MAVNKKVRNWEKKSEEFHQILPLLNLYNKGLIGLCCTEEPDFHLHFGDRTVGVEFSKFTCADEKDEFNGFKKVLSEYAEKFDKIKLKKQSLYKYQDTPYRIKIWFEAGFKPHVVEWKKVKKHAGELFDDLDRLLFPSSEFIETRFVERVNPEPADNLIKSEFQICYINPISPVSPSFVVDIIKKKEAKLKKYILQERNKSIQEYWLAIGIEEQYDFHSIELPKDYITIFSKIFAIQNLFVKQLL